MTLRTKTKDRLVGGLAFVPIALLWYLGWLYWGMRDVFLTAPVVLVMLILMKRLPWWAQGLTVAAASGFLFWLTKEQLKPLLTIKPEQAKEMGLLILMVLGLGITTIFAHLGTKVREVIGTLPEGVTKVIRGTIVGGTIIVGITGAIIGATIVVEKIVGTIGVGIVGVVIGVGVIIGAIIGLLARSTTDEMAFGETAEEIAAEAIALGAIVGAIIVGIIGAIIVGGIVEEK